MTNKLLSTMVAAFLFSGICSAQGEIQLRVGQQSGWDPRAREGHCDIRVWVDHQAELQMRGDRIFVRTLEGGRSYDEGSTCSSPLPYNAVRDFQIRQTAGRSRVTVRQQPNRGNNFTGMLVVNDDQGGGDHYAFEVSWRAEGDGSNVPAPFFDDIRACQDSVRQRFLSRNGRDAYIDFDNFAERQNQNRAGNQNRNRNRNNNNNQELITGRGNARNRSDSRDLSYSCAVDTRSSQVQSGDYQYTSAAMRGNNRNALK